MLSLLLPCIPKPKKKDLNKILNSIQNCLSTIEETLHLFSKTHTSGSNTTPSVPHRSTQPLEQHPCTIVRTPQHRSCPNRRAALYHQPLRTPCHTSHDCLCPNRCAAKCHQPPQAPFDNTATGVLIRSTASTLVAASPPNVACNYTARIHSNFRVPLLHRLYSTKDCFSHLKEKSERKAATTVPSLLNLSHKRRRT